MIRRKACGLSYLDMGSGPDLVLLHGIPGSAFSWAAVGEWLSADFRVVIPDLLGFGASDPPAGEYYMQAQAERLAALLDCLGIRECLLGGHDFGGPVAVTLRRLFPQVRVTRLILSATNLFTDTHVPWPLRLAKVPLLATPLFWVLAGNRLGLRLMHQAAAVQKGTCTWGDFQRHLTPGGVSLTRRIFQRSLANLAENYREVERSLGTIDVPTLLLWGDGDPFFPTSVAHRCQSAIPGSRLRVLERTGHFVPEERPQAVAGEIRALFAAGATRSP